jgi:hypothetical protein
MAAASCAEEGVLAQMTDVPKAAVEAEKAKLLAELSQAAEPRLAKNSGTLARNILRE